MKPYVLYFALVVVAILCMHYAIAAATNSQCHVSLKISSVNRESNSVIPSVYLYSVEFGTSNGVLYCDPHGQGMTEAASNVLKLVIEQYKDMGYKLTK